MEYKLLECILCKESELTTVYSLVPTPLGDNFKKDSTQAKNLPLFTLDLMQCKSCSQVQLSTIVDPEEVYDEEYQYTTDISLGLSEHFHKSALNIIKSFKLLKSDRVLEIGSNKGIMLNSFQLQGLNVLGVEPAEWAANQATSNDIETINDFFTLTLAKNIKKTHGLMNLIVANNVMANIPILKDVIEGIELLLEPDKGVFVFETSYFLDVIRDNLIDTVYHEHISYFSITAIAQLFDKCQLHLFDAELINTKGGSIRGYVSKKGSSYEMTKRCTILLKKESLLDSSDQKNYIQMKNNLENLKQEIIDLKNIIRNENEKVVCYGASVGCTTMLYSLELTDCDILLDDNKEKIDRFSPGLAIPVLDSMLINTLEVKYVFILAWRYVEQIKEKHKYFLSQGGKFILIDLPRHTLRVISE